MAANVAERKARVAQARGDVRQWGATALHHRLEIAQGTLVVTNHKVGQGYKWVEANEHELTNQQQQIAFNFSPTTEIVVLRLAFVVGDEGGGALDDLVEILLIE